MLVHVGSVEPISIRLVLLKPLNAKSTSSSQFSFKATDIQFLTFCSYVVTLFIVILFIFLYFC